MRFPLWTTCQAFVYVTVDGDWPSTSAVTGHRVPDPKSSLFLDPKGYKAAASCLVFPHLLLHPLHFSFEFQQQHHFIFLFCNSKTSISHRKGEWFLLLFSYFFLLKFDVVWIFFHLFFNAKNQLIRFLLLLLLLLCEALAPLLLRFVTLLQRFQFFLEFWLLFFFSVLQWWKTYIN